MNLSYIRAVLHEAPLRGALLTRDGETVRNLRKFKAAIEMLQYVTPFATRVQELMGSAIYSTTQDEIGVGSVSQAEELIGVGNEVVRGAIALRDTLDATLPETPPTSVIVTLPPNQNLTSVLDVLTDLEQALGHLIRNEKVGGELYITSWEPGSLTLILSLNALAAVLVVARLLKSAALTYHEMQRGRLIGQHVKTLKIKNETLLDLQEAHKKLVADLVEREAKALEVDVFEGEEPERTGRVRHSIRLVAELLDRGTRITPALEMPEEPRSEFPDVEKLTESPIKELTDEQAEDQDDDSEDAEHA